jgi:hypothetical protein
MNAPPKIQTITGSGFVGAGSGVHTFRDRQFSSLVVAYAMEEGSICGQMGPRAVALSVVVHGAAGCGGFQRLSPPVDAANGMPRNDRTPPAVAPWTIPLSVGTSRLEVDPPESGGSPPSFDGFAPGLDELEQAPRHATVRAKAKERAAGFIARSVLSSLGSRDGHGDRVARWGSAHGAYGSSTGRCSLLGRTSRQVDGNPTGQQVRDPPGQ